MRPLLGKVDAQGVVRFDSADIEECREFLYQVGLRPERIKGWNKPGFMGAIYFDKETRGWQAAYWRTV